MNFVSAWDAVARAHKQPAKAWWLISQPDHAALSGAMAAGFTAPGFPRVDPVLAQAIGLHDAGWARFQSEADPQAAPRLHADGRPVAFFEIAPADFLQAWRASIERAERVCPAGGYIVSRHFSVLGEYRLNSASDVPDVQEQVRGFIAQERARQEGAATAHPREVLESLLQVLQFCDLLSLYVCSGAREPVEFPQEFAAGRVRLHRRDGLFVLTPSPFAREISVAVQARRYPRGDKEVNTRTFRFPIR